MDHISVDNEFKLPHEWYEEGQECLNRGDLEGALKAFEKALELDPFYPQPLCGISKVLWQQGKLREAAEKVVKALEFDPNDPDVIMQCANIFSAVGQKTDALEILKAYMERNPWDVEIEEFAKRLEAQSTDAKALPIPQVSQDSTAQKAAEPSVADILTREGEEQIQKGKSDRARVCFEMALEHDSDHAKAHNNLGVLLWQDNKLDEALEHFQIAFHQSPEDPDIIFNSFHALVQANLVDVAKDLIKLHIQQNPFNEEAWKMYDQLSSIDEMIHWDPSNLSPEVAEIYAETARKLLKKGDTYGAAEALHRALRIQPDHLDALKLLAGVHEDLGHPEEAENFYRAALEIKPDSEKIVVRFAQFLCNQNRNDEAQEILSKFLKNNKGKKAEEMLKRIESLGNSQ